MTRPHELVHGEPALADDGSYMGNMGGLTKREEFAKAAMIGLLTNSAWRDAFRDPSRAIAAEAVRQADDLLAELNRRPIPAMPEESSS